MENIVRVKVMLRNDLNKQITTQISVDHLSTMGRTKIALKILAICWGMGILFIFIPVAHFVLVPSALLAGVFLFFQKFKLQELSLGCEMKCPGCSHIWQLQPSAFNWPKRDECPQCKAELLTENAK